MTDSKDFLRLHIPVDGLTPKQRKRAVAVANRIEGKVAGMLASGADVDRVLGWVEGYFPEE